MRIMLDNFTTDTLKGLSQKEAEYKLQSDGYNELPTQKKQTPIDIFLNIIREPMLLLLLLSGIIYIFIGEIGDALMLLTFVFVVIGITFYQERKTERALEALRNLSSPRALVIRDGKAVRIPGREVVVGDLIILKEGDRVPADGQLIECTNLLVDESLLTGESASVRKSSNPKPVKMKRAGRVDNMPFAYSGTLIVQGRGIVRVVSVGSDTEIGKIGKSLESLKEENTLLEKETSKLIKTFAVAGLILCLLVFIVYGITRGNWIDGFLSGLTLAMAMLPEEFSVVLLVFLTLGAWRISKKNVLTRKLPAIETLGAATVLCVDKTGTITQNRMQLTKIYSKNMIFDLNTAVKPLPEKYHPLMEYSILASQKDPFDPIEKEIKSVGTARLADTEHLHKNWILIREYPLSNTLLALSHVWESPDKNNYVIAAKGAPEAIFDLCHLSPTELRILNKTIFRLSSQGLRLLAVAKSLFQKTKLPDQQHDYRFELVGILGFKDPLRRSIADSVLTAYKAGLRTIMITGDYPETAKFIAQEIGLKNNKEFIRGEELETMDAKTLRQRIKTVNIFARVVPEQKLLIVNALKKDGEIVAMTGDGVNDAPALKSANIGIAMGDRGTDVAREAADLVLLDDNFSSIVEAVRLGRRIYANLKKAMAYIFAVHIPIAGISLLPVLFKLPIVLLPAHIAFLELIIDPACSTVFEAEKEDDNSMNQKPRDLKEHLFGRKNFLLSLLQGISILIVVFTVFLIALNHGNGEKEARTLTFATLIFANILLIITNLSYEKNLFEILKVKNKPLWLVLSGTLISFLLVLYIPSLRNLFHFSFLHFEDLILTFLAGIVSLLWFEILKFINKKYGIISV